MLGELEQIVLLAVLRVGDGAYGGLPEAPPDDTGEALGLKPSRLTLTIGFGPSLFEKFDLAGRRPEALVDLPQFAGDNLDRARSGGDLCVQACADDPQVAVHAVRNLARIGFGKVSVRWSQLGFGKTSSTTPEAQTPRNLMGFKDGTRNIAGTETDRLKKFVWVDEKDVDAILSHFADDATLTVQTDNAVFSGADEIRRMFQDFCDGSVSIFHEIKNIVVEPDARKVATEQSYIGELNDGTKNDMATSIQ